MITRFKGKKISFSILVLLMLLFPLLTGHSGYFMTLFVMTCIYAITAMALNLLVGYGGQVSIGNAGFLTFGGYTVAILLEKFDLSIWVLIPLAGILTAVIGLLIGLPAVRLSGHFLAVATLGFGISVPQIALNWDSLTKGYNGMAVMRPSYLSSDTEFFYVILISTLLIMWLIKNIVHSGIGRAFIAIRDSEVAAQATGINVAFYKTLMFVISAFFTGIAGGLYSYWVGFVSPEDFTIITSLLLLGMVVVGGLATISGPILGAILFTVLPHFTDSFIGITNIVIGVAVILIIMYRPAGIVSILELLKQKKEGTKHQVKEEVQNVNV
jgi:branched-chain amino acid transport system permease protein